MDKRVRLAVNRTERKVESCIVGTSDKSYAVRCLWKVFTNCKKGYINSHSSLKSITNTIDIIATDGNYSYNEVVKFDIFRDKINKHIIDKAETCLVEAYNSSMRDRLTRLGRKSKAYSKSKEMLELSLVLWTERKNTGRKDWKKF